MAPIALPFDAARPLELHVPNDDPSIGEITYPECVNMRTQFVSMPALIKVRDQPERIEMREYE